jgi:hypothetical protein
MTKKLTQGEEAHAKAQRGKGAKKRRLSHAKTQSKQSFLSFASFASLRAIFSAPSPLSALA